MVQFSKEDEKWMYYNNSELNEKINILMADSDTYT